jgi:hypothetical protein
MPLTPFPIYDLRAGLQLDKEPWIAPDQAWRELDDAYVFRGRLRKRLGYQRFGELSVVRPAQSPDVAGERTLVGSGANAFTTIGPGTTGYAALGPTDRKYARRAILRAGTAFVFHDDDGRGFYQTMYTESGGTVLRSEQWRAPNVPPVVFADAIIPGPFGGGPLVLPGATGPVFAPGRVPGTTTVSDSAGQVISFDVDGVASGDVNPLGVCFESNSEIGVSFANPATPLVTVTQQRIDLTGLEYTAVTTMTGAASKVFAVACDAPIGRLLTTPITIGGGGQTITFDLNGVPSGNFDAAGPNYVDFEAGVVVVTFSALPAPDAIVAFIEVYVGDLDFDTGEYFYDIGYDYGSGDAKWQNVYERRQTLPSGVDRQNMVMAVHEWRPETGSNRLIACDRRRLFQWDAPNDEFDDKFGSDFWACEPSDFFSFAPGSISSGNGRDVLVIANGVNFLTYLTTAGAFREVNTDWGSVQAPHYPLTGASGDGVYARDIASAKWVFYYHGRLVLLDTTENTAGTGYRRPQRARWSIVAPQVDVGASWRPLDYQDASTSERIVSARMVGDELMVWFEKSLWRLVWQDDYRQPFAWQQVDTVYGSQASHSSVAVGREAITISDIALVATDGRTEKAVDEAVPELVSNANPAALSQAFGTVAQKYRLMLWTYPETNDTYPSKMLALQYEDRAVAKFGISMHCFGEWLSEKGDVNWNDVDGNFDQDIPFDFREDRGGYALVMAGGYDGVVYSILDAQSDDGAVIPMHARSVRLNPFQQAERGSRLARLGFVDFLVAAGGDTSFTVSFVDDTNTEPWMTKTVHITAAEMAGKEHVKKRVLVNKTSRYHQIVIDHAEAPGLQFDAITPWFEPAGEARPTL